MPFWKVRPGRLMGHNGQTLKAGAVIEIPRRVASESADLLEECTADGTVLDAPAPSWQHALETIPAHEHVDELRAARGRLEAVLLELRAQAEDAAAAAADQQKHVANAQASLAALDKQIEQAIADAKALHDKRLKEEAAATKKATAKQPEA